ncbi:MAG: hypothetical protein KI791_08375 [Cyclobacteriaceae bacterium]|nr:hypothetical protein [Cyclobacteriaceae bacterium SS2]
MKNNENWKDIFQRLEKDSEGQRLKPKDQEKLALAVYMVGRDEEAHTHIHR